MYVAGVFIVMVLDIYHIKRDDTIAVGLARRVDGQVVSATAAITPPDETTMRRAQAIIEAPTVLMSLMASCITLSGKRLMCISAAGQLRKQPRSVYRKERVYISPSNMLNDRGARPEHSQCGGGCI